MSLECPRCGLKRDYIPGGGTATEATNVRAVRPGEFYQCGVSTSYDDQSGPIYCGARATLIGDTKNGIVAACERHERGLRRIEKKVV